MVIFQSGKLCKLALVKASCVTVVRLCFVVPAKFTFLILFLKNHTFLRHNIYGQSQLLLLTGLVYLVLSDFATSIWFLFILFQLQGWKKSVD